MGDTFVKQAWAHLQVRHMRLSNAVRKLYATQVYENGNKDEGISVEFIGALREAYLLAAPETGGLRREVGSVMRDEELVRLLAEKVMGYRPLHFGEPFCYPGWADGDKLIAPRWIENTKLDENDWNPLAFDRDSCAVLDKMAADGVQPWLGISDRGTWRVEWWKDDNSYEVESPDRRRAVVLAALKAVGVDTTKGAEGGSDGL